MAINNNPLRGREKAAALNLSVPALLKWRLTQLAHIDGHDVLGVVCKQALLGYVELRIEELRRAEKEGRIPKEPDEAEAFLAKAPVARLR